MNHDKEIDTCVSILEKGGIILYPTDTIWGIGCDATNEQAVKKVYALKKREERKSMIILLAEENEISLYAKPPSALLKKELHKSSKPLTVIYPEAKNLPGNLINTDGTIAIRIVNDEFCKSLIIAFGKPIVSTSANISGEKYPENYNAVSQLIKEGVDYIVKIRQEEIAELAPSRILKWTENDELIVIRE